MKKSVLLLLIILCISVTGFAQKNLSGVVTDEYGDPMPGVTVLVKNTTYGTVTNIDGEYSIVFPEDANTLVFSFIGLKTQEIVIHNQVTINVQMEAVITSLAEVVAVGYGTQKKATVTGALSQIQTEDLLQSSQANISNAMVGRVSGLLSVQRSGEPGNNSTELRIRGSGTFTGDASPMVMVDGIESDNYNNIDANEIEDITVLKDASATAVYGVRGANGVILITTKRGTKGRPVVKLTSNVAMNSFTDLWENLGSYEYATYFNEARRYDSYTEGLYKPKFTDDEIEHFRTGDDPIFYPNTNWIGEMIKDRSFQTNHNANVSGGTDFVKYFVSAGFLSQDALFNNNASDRVTGWDTKMTYKRYNFRGNFDFDISKKFKASISLSSQIDEVRSPSRMGDNAGTFRHFMSPVFYMNPYSGPGIVDDKIVVTRETQIPNPYQRMYGNGFSVRFKNYITSTVKLDYEIINGLTLHGKFSYWNLMENRKNYTKGIVTYKPLRLEDGSIYYAANDQESPFNFGESNDKNRKVYSEVGANYVKSIGNHNISALLLYNQDKQYNPSLLYSIPSGRQALVGRVTYNFSNRYMLEFNAGYNGTENFAVGRRFGFFPAFSAGWTVSEESFFPQSNIVTYLKLRGSYGEVGNDRIGGQRFLYNPTTYYFEDSGSWASKESYYFGEVGSSFQAYPKSFEGTLGNEMLTWERAKKSNVGMDLNLFQNKLRVTTDLFWEDRNNILANPQTFPNIIGTDFPSQNFGKMKNNGYELEVEFRDKIAAFNYWAKVMYNYANNEIIYQNEVLIQDAPWRSETGQSNGQFFGLLHQGFYNTWEEVNTAVRPASTWQNNQIMPGDAKYKDVNGDGIIDQNDYVPIGYSNFPENIYGFSFGADFKGFDFSVLLQGASRVSRRQSGGEIQPYNNDNRIASFVPGWSWSPEKYLNGEEIKLPRLTADMVQQHNYLASTFMIQDASYLRLKNIEVGYTLQSVVLNRLNISSMRLFVNADNLITWDNLFPGADPEQLSMSGGDVYYPLTKTANLGLNITF